LDEDIEEEKELQKTTDNDGKSLAESDVASVSEQSIPDVILDSVSDGTTVSNVDDDDDYFMPWKDSVYARKSDNHSRIIDETVITSVSEESVLDDILDMMTNDEFVSDRTTVSDVEVEEGLNDVIAEDDNDFSQWTEDTMDAIVASFDLAAENSEAAATAGVCVGQKGYETSTVSILDSPVTTPPTNGVRILLGNIASPSGAKRHLELPFDTSQEPPSTRQRQIVNEAAADAQSKLSPLRKTLSSKLSLQTP